MSGSMSAAVRFEDHFGPVGADPAPHAGALRDLVEQMHRSVVAATAAVDRATKIESWESYRRARAQALGILASTSDTPSTPRLRSI